MADASYSPLVYRKQGGAEQVIAAGGQLTYEGQTAVTQATSITTGVTCNAKCGQITTASQTVAAGAEADFVVTNSAVAAGDVVSVCIGTHTSAGTFAAVVSAVAAGSFTVRLTNLHATAAGNDVLVINFLVHHCTA